MSIKRSYTYQFTPYTCSIATNKSVIMFAICAHSEFYISEKVHKAEGSVKIWNAVA